MYPNRSPALSVIVALNVRLERGYLRQVVKAALEEALVGEHGQTGRSVLRVGARDRSRIELLPQQASAGACLLDLGDHRGQAGRDLPAQSSRKVPGLLGLFRAPPHQVRADSFLRLRDLLSLDGENPLKDVSHARAVA